MINEYRQKLTGLPDLLNYGLFVAEGILLLKDGGLCAGFYYRGPDLNSSDPNEMATLASVLNRTLCQLGNGWMLHSDLIRKESSHYVNATDCAFPDPISQLIDEERRKNYLDASMHFESTYTMVWTYRPPKEVEVWFKKIFLVDTENKHNGWEKILNFFQQKIMTIQQSLSRVFILDSMNSQQLFNHLHLCIRGGSGSIILPSHPVYVDSLLGNSDLFGGLYPMLDDSHLRMISLVGFPLETQAGVLQALEQLPLLFRWSNRYIFLDALTARKLIKVYRRNWFQKRHNMLGLLREVVLPQDGPGFVNADALNMTEDADQAIEEVDSGLVSYGFYSSVIVLYSKNFPLIEEVSQIILKQLEQCGFSGKVETINALESYLGSLPGHGYQNIRRPIVHTLNLADFLPLTSVWAGLESHPCRYYPPQSPPLFYAATVGATPFRFHLHVQDIGHTLIVGDTGSGKSTLVGLIAAQHLRYPNAQVFIFDKGYSAYILCQALGGAHYDLCHPEQNIAFCPLQAIHHEAQLLLMLEWLELLMDCQGLTINSGQRQELRAALQRIELQTSRTLTDLQCTLQDVQMKSALDYYTLSGPMGHVLDAKQDSLQNSQFQVFEMTHLLEKNNKAVIPILSYLFSQIESRLTGAPTLIIIEEGHRFLTGKFGERLEQWLRELRKRNTAVIFLTQHLAEIFNAAVKPILLNSCKSKIFLPNHHADDGFNASLFAEVGLTATQMQIIKNAQTKKDYYYTSPLGCRLMDLNLSPFALSFLGVDGQADRALVDEYIKKYQQNWIYHWLCARGLTDEAQHWQETVQLSAKLGGYDALQNIPV